MYVCAQMLINSVRVWKCLLTSTWEPRPCLISLPYSESKLASKPAYHEPQWELFLFYCELAIEPKVRIILDCTKWSCIFHPDGHGRWGRTTNRLTYIISVCVWSLMPRTAKTLRLCIRNMLWLGWLINWFWLRHSSTGWNAIWVIHSWSVHMSIMTISELFWHTLAKNIYALAC